MKILKKSSSLKEHLKRAWNEPRLFAALFGAVVGSALASTAFLIGHREAKPANLVKIPPLTVSSNDARETSRSKTSSNDTRDTSGSKINADVLSQDIEDRERGEVNQSESGLFLPVKDLSVNTCWNRGNTLKCEVTYAFGPRTVTTTLYVVPETSKYLHVGLGFPKASDIDLTECQAERETVNCHASWEFKPSFYDREVMKIHSLNSNDANVSGSIIFTSYHPDKGLYQGQLHTKDGASAQVFIARETFMRSAPTLAAGIPIAP